MRQCRSSPVRLWGEGLVLPAFYKRVIRSPGFSIDASLYVDYDMLLLQLVSSCRHQSFGRRRPCKWYVVLPRTLCSNTSPYVPSLGQRAFVGVSASAVHLL